MSIRSMHYDLRSKLDKLNSNQYRGLSIPEIDWKLNEALNLYVHTLVGSNKKSPSEVFINTRVADELYPLIEDITGVLGTTVEGVKVIPVPADYSHSLKIKVEISTVTCEEKVKANVFVRQKHEFVESTFLEKDSFMWREVNTTFDKRGWVFSDTLPFNLGKYSLTYIKKHPYIHNATDYSLSGYTLPNGTVLTGRVDCELPTYVQSAIVDLAVLIITGDLSSSYESKITKVKLNN